MENRILSIQSRRAFLVTCASASSLSADVNPDWTEPFIPHRIADNLYYVGSKGLASFLITTPEGHILINSNLESSVPQIRSSIEKLGFQFNDVKILLISHAHWDHCAGSSRIKSETRAKYMVMEADIPDIETGGKSNFRYSNSQETFYPPVKVDQALHDDVR